MTSETSSAQGRTICPAHVRRTLRPISSPYTPYACGAQRILLPVAVGAMNIHDIRDRQTDRRQTRIVLFYNAPGRGDDNSSSIHVEKQKKILLAGGRHKS